MKQLVVCNNWASSTQIFSEQTFDSLQVRLLCSNVFRSLFDIIKQHLPTRIATNNPIEFATRDEYAIVSNAIGVPRMEYFL